MKIEFTEAAAKELARFYAKARGNKAFDELTCEDMEKEPEVTIKDLLRLKALAIRAARSRGSEKVTVEDVRKVLRAKGI